MAKNKEQIKLLFLQVRDDDMKEHEFLCFDRLIDIPQQNFIRIDAVRDQISPALLEGIDGVILAGTGHYLSDGGYPKKMPELIDLIKMIHERKIPLLAIGFGHQVVAKAFDGEIVEDPDLREIGTVELEQLPEASDDPIFKHLPAKFLVQIGHNHSVVEAPKGTRDIITNHKKDCCEVFVFEDSPIYAIQFHPELEHKDVVVRMNYYKKKYFDRAEVLDQVIEESRETPHANRILDLFVDEVVCKQD